MCKSAEAAYLLTHTLAPLPMMDGEDWLPRPERHAVCDRYTHAIIFTNKRGKESLRWLVIPNCKHCCRWVSAEKTRWRKRMRRAFPGAELLDVREETIAGMVHLHMAVTGLPAGIPASGSAAGKRDPRILEMRRIWPAGFIDFKPRTAGNGGALGAYLGKYLTKQDVRMARGYRRWNRTRGFAPDVFMDQWRHDRDLARRAADLAGRPDVACTALRATLSGSGSGAGDGLHPASFVVSPGQQACAHGSP
jgi:hypothetical protein